MRTEVWITRDDIGEYFITIGGKPTNETYNGKYSYCHQEKGKVNVYVASNHASADLAASVAKGMRRNTTRRIA